VKTASEITYIVSGGALNSTQSNPIRSGQNWTTDIFAAAISDTGDACDTCVKLKGDILNNICMNLHV